MCCFALQNVDSEYEGAEMMRQSCIVNKVCKYGTCDQCVVDFFCVGNL